MSIKKFVIVAIIVWLTLETVNTLLKIVLKNMDKKLEKEIEKLVRGIK